MAESDCDPLTATYAKIALNLGERPGFDTIDKIVEKMQERFPIDREMITDAVVTFTRQGKKETLDELARQLKELKIEARSDVKLRARIDQLIKEIESGLIENPSIRQRKVVTEALRVLRLTRDRFLNEARIRRQMADLDRRIATKDTSVLDRPEPKFNDAALDALRSERDAKVKRLRNMRADSQRSEQLRNEIDSLNEQIANGRRVQKEAAPKRELPPEVQALVDEKKVLRRKLDLIEQTKNFEQQLREGPLNPPVSRKTEQIDKEVEKLMFARDRARRQVRQAIDEMKPKGVLGWAMEPFNLARSLLATGDLPPLLRQGAFTTFSHPVMSLKNFAKGTKAIFSGNYDQKISDNIRNRYWSLMYDVGGLSLTDPDSPRLSQQEEKFMSHLSHKLPFLKQMERGYTSYLNLIRADLFDTFAATLAKNGEMTKDEAKSIARFINASTGRASLGQLSESAAPLLNNFFFAPRYNVSRFQMAIALHAYTGEKSIQKIVRKEYAKAIVGAATVIFALKTAAEALSDDDEEVISFDPRSTKFMKLDVRGRHVDLLGGLSQPIVITTRAATGEKVTSTGKVRPLRGDEVSFGGDKVSSVIGRFLQGKLAPGIGIPLAMLDKENIVGESMDITTAEGAKNIVSGSFVPITWQGLASEIDGLVGEEHADPYKEFAAAVLISTLEAIGAGSTKYDKKP